MTAHHVLAQAAFRPGPPHGAGGRTHCGGDRGAAREWAGTAEHRLHPRAGHGRLCAGVSSLLASCFRGCFTCKVLRHTALETHSAALAHLQLLQRDVVHLFLRPQRQVGAHGSGARIPPMDEQVVALTLVTPGRGTLRLSADDADPSLFYMARVGLGALGVVSEVTLQAVPAHRLLQHTFVSTLQVVAQPSPRRVLSPPAGGCSAPIPGGQQVNVTRRSTASLRPIELP